MRDDHHPRCDLLLRSLCFDQNFLHLSLLQSPRRHTAWILWMYFQFLEAVVCKEYISSYRKSLQKWLRELYNIYTNFIMTNVDINSDTKYTINNDTNNHDTRDLHK